MTMRYNPDTGHWVPCEPPQANGREEAIGALIAGEVIGTITRYRIVRRRKILDIDEWLTEEKPDRYRVPAIYRDMARARRDLRRLQQNREPGAEFRIIVETTQLAIRTDY